MPLQYIETFPVLYAVLCKLFQRSRSEIANGNPKADAKVHTPKINTKCFHGKFQ